MSDIFPFFFLLKCYTLWTVYYGVGPLVPVVFSRIIIYVNYTTLPLPEGEFSGNELRLIFFLCV